MAVALVNARTSSSTTAPAGGREPQPLVPLDDLYLAPAAVTGVPADHDLAVLVADAYGVVVRRDHANRLAVTVADAYRIRDARMRAEVELRKAAGPVETCTTRTIEER
jgi:hypothetical protein